MEGGWHKDVQDSPASLRAQVDATLTESSVGFLIEKYRSSVIGALFLCPLE